MDLWTWITSPFRRGAPTAAPPLGITGAPLAPAPPNPPPRPRRQRETLIGAMVRRLDSIVNGLSGLGGTADKGATGEVDLSRGPLSMVALDQLSRFNGYAQAIIERLPEDATRRGWRVDDATSAAGTMEVEDQRLNIRAVVKHAAALARTHGTSVVLIVVDEELPDGVDPRALLATPLDWRRVRRVLNLVVFDAYEATPLTYNSDLRSPTVRDPLTWQLSSANVTTDLAGRIVHTSRLLVFSGRKLSARQRLQNRGLDDSVLQAVWDQVRNLTSVDQAGAAIAQELKLNVMKIEGLAGLSTSDQSALFDLRMQTLAKSKSLLNMVLIGDGESFESLASPMTGFEHLHTAAKDALAAVSGMPQTVLFGDSSGTLGGDAGATHRPLWANIVAAWQRYNLDDPLTRLYGLLYRASEGVTHGVEPESWSIVYLPLDEPTEADRAGVEKIEAETDVLRIQAGILPAEHVAASRFGPTGYRHEMLPYDPGAVDAEALAAAQRQQGELEAAARVDAETIDRTAYVYAEPSDVLAWRAARDAVAAIVALDDYAPGSTGADRPHATLLYLGAIPERATTPIATQVGRIAADTLRAPLLVRGLEVWDADDGQAIVLVLDAARLDVAHGHLHRTCARWISAESPGPYRAHVTLGYTREMSADQRRAVLAVPPPATFGTVARVALSRSGADVVSLDR